MSKEFDQRIGNAIEENLESPPELAAANEVQEEILSPLNKFGDSLGLTPEEISVIQKYAQVASAEMRRRVEGQRTQNPLMQMDVLFAQEIAQTKSDPGISGAHEEEHLFHLQLARKALRESQGAIKKQVFSEMQLAEQKGEEIDMQSAVQRICDRQERKQGMDGYFYIKLAEGRRGSFEAIVAAVCGEDLVKRINRETDTFNYSDRRTMHDIPTIAEGVKGEIPSWSTQYREPYLHFGVVFTSESVLRIAQSADLSALK